ncbi:hypothetical protein J2S17_001723 [Cytobacillus purgationiresistens]|uniref:Uncharacterized protein n=1 Tax=Cytobacillus purgationiresistens TaxID=863449 RepID=A0ABU0AF14_9BACI|nr:hypothetical protein [Cytobacillus purgationiresistens]
MTQYRLESAGCLSEIERIAQYRLESARFLSEIKVNRALQIRKDGILI